MRTGLTKQEKTTDIWFDEKDPLIHIRTHNTDLKNRLTAYSRRYPAICKLTDEDAETGCMEFEIRKGRFSFRLTAPYSEERRRAASEAAKKHSGNLTHNLANLLMKYLSVQREKSRKYSQRWQQQHTADELKTIAAAVNYLSEHGISNLDELDASLSSVSDKAYSIRAGMKTAEQRMKELQKLIEYGKNYTEYKPIHDELKKLQNGWTNKRDKYEEAHRAELTLWDAANRYLHANLTDIKMLPISKWKQEYADLKEQRDTDYTKLKATRTEVAELQKIRRCVDIALRADQPEQAQTRTKLHEQER